MRHDRITRPVARPGLPDRSYHKHESCGHYCVGYGCLEKEDCRKCRNAAFNAKRDAERRAS